MVKERKMAYLIQSSPKVQRTSMDENDIDRRGEEEREREERSKGGGVRRLMDKVVV